MIFAKKIMNILLLSTHLNYGGIASYLISLAEGLKERGHKVFIASSGGQAQEYLIHKGIICINIPISTKNEISPKILLSFLKLKKELENYDIDIIHAHTRVTQVLGFFLSKALGLPYISTCHGFFKRRFSRRIFPAWGAQVIAISQSVAEHLEFDFKVKREAIVVVNNGIDFEKFTPVDSETKRKIKAEFNLPESAPLIAMIARLSEVKGHAFFIQAMPHILKEFPKAAFLIVGEGRLKQGLVRQVKKLNLEQSVFFLPMQPETPKVLSIIDCLVSPSLQEGLGLSIIEAQAAGVPVVAFAVGGIVSLIEDRQSGLLVRGQDVSGLALAVERILKDNNLRQYIAKNARENIKQNFSISKMVEETLAVYSKAKGLSKKP